jgi:hypothetical protein
MIGRREFITRRGDTVAGDGTGDAGVWILYAGLAAALGAGGQCTNGREPGQHARAGRRRTRAMLVVSTRCRSSSMSRLEIHIGLSRPDAHAS